MTGKFSKTLSSSPGALGLAVKSYFKIGGSQRAAAFAYYAFFSLFPLVLMTVAIISLFVDGERSARDVVGYFKMVAPLNAQTNQDLYNTINDVIKVRGGMTVIAPVIFFWGAFRFFNVLIRAVNKAWGTKPKGWWRLPLKNFFLLAITGLTILLGLAVPVMARVVRHWLFSTTDFVAWVYDGAVILGPLIVLFFGLSLLYRLAPYRSTTFADIWSAALTVAASLCLLESLFGVYIRNFAKFNLVYGTFGGMMALLMWIYLSGCLIIFGACLSAAQARVKAHWWTSLFANR